MYPWNVNMLKESLSITITFCHVPCKRKEEPNRNPSQRNHHRKYKKKRSSNWPLCFNGKQCVVLKTLTPAYISDHYSCRLKDALGLPLRSYSEIVIRSGRAIQHMNLPSTELETLGPSELVLSTPTSSSFPGSQAGGLSHPLSPDRDMPGIKSGSFGRQSRCSPTEPWPSAQTHSQDLCKICILVNTSFPVGTSSRTWSIANM